MYCTCSTMYSASSTAVAVIRAVTGVAIPTRGDEGLPKWREPTRRSYPLVKGRHLPHGLAGRGEWSSPGVRCRALSVMHALEIAGAAYPRHQRGGQGL